jgi:hypothetical protein
MFWQRKHPRLTHYAHAKFSLHHSISHTSIPNLFCRTLSNNDFIPHNITPFDLSSEMSVDLPTALLYSANKQTALILYAVLRSLLSEHATKKTRQLTVYIASSITKEHMGHKKATTMDDGRWSEGHSNSSPC